MDDEHTDHDEDASDPADGAAPDRSGPTFAEGDLGTIQGILFGAQAERFEQEIAQLEQRLTTRIDTDQANLARSADRLRNRVETAVAELKADAKSEHDARIAAIDDLAQSHRDHAKYVQESFDGIRAELRDLVEQRDGLVASFERRFGAIERALDEEGAHRHGLAELLEAAARTLRTSESS